MAEVLAKNAQVGSYYLSKYGKELKVLRQEGSKTAVLNLHTENEVLVPGTYPLIPLIKDETAASLPKPVKTSKVVSTPSEKVDRPVVAKDDLSDPEVFRTSVLESISSKPRSFSDLFGVFGAKLPESAHKILNVRLKLALSHLVRTRGIVEKGDMFHVAPAEKSDDQDS